MYTSSARYNHIFKTREFRDRTTKAVCGRCAFAQILAAVTKGWKIGLVPSPVGKTPRTLLPSSRETSALRCLTYKFKGKFFTITSEQLIPARPHFASPNRSRWKLDDVTNVLNLNQSVYCDQYLDAFRILSVWKKLFFPFRLLFFFLREGTARRSSITLI